MTVNTNNSRSSQNGDGVSVTFNIGFYFLQNADLAVYVAGVLQMLTTDYTVSGAGNPSGGSVTFAVPPPAAVNNVVIIRDPDQLQSTKYPPNDPFPAKSHETALDKLTMLLQRARDLLGRSITFADSETSGASTTLPSPTAGYLLGWSNDVPPKLSNFANTGAGGGGIPLPVSTTNGGTGGAYATFAVLCTAIKTQLGLGTLATKSAVAAVDLAASAVGAFAMLNGTIGTPTTNAGTLTIPLKTLAGADPSAADPVYFIFGNATGGYTVIAVTAAFSWALTSGATYGMVNSVAARLYLAAVLNNAGTGVIPAIWNPVAGSASAGYSLAALLDDSIVTVTTPAANAAQTLYGGTAAASRPVRAAAYIEVTEAAVGTHGTLPTKVRLIVPGMKRTGDKLGSSFTPIVSSTNTATMAYNTGSAPLNTDGAQVASVSITPQSALNFARVRVGLNGAVSSATTRGVMALFQDAGTCLRAAVVDGPSNGQTIEPGVDYFGPFGVAVATAFKTRVGTQGTGGTFYVGKDTSGTQLFTTATTQSFTEIEEIIA